MTAEAPEESHGESIEDSVKKNWCYAEKTNMDDTSPVVVRTFLNQFEADIAHSALEAAGIESMIRSDDCGGMRPHLWMGGIALMVRSEDRERAEEVLASSPLELPDEPTED